MAGEITILEANSSGAYSAIFYFPIPVGIRILRRDGGGATVAGQWWPVTPSANLPPDTLDATERAALDNGEALFLRHAAAQGDGETDAALLARLRTRYAAFKSSLAADYADRFRHRGKRYGEIA